MEVLRKYNVQKSIYFPLIETGGEDYTVAAAHVAGDSQRSFDGAAFNNSTNAFAHEGNGIYSLVLTAAEHQAEIIVITIIDQTGPKVWQDQTIIVQTYGNPAASFEFDLDTATVVASSVLGNVGGNVVGTVASVVGNVGGNVVGSVGSIAAAGIAAASYTAGALAAIGTAVMTRAYEGVETVEEGLRLFRSALAGKLSGGGTFTLRFRNRADTRDRIVATVDAVEDRTNIVTDVLP